jgi:hypothetical protein
LPERWVAKIFQELQGNYGNRFLNHWKIGQQTADGQDVGVANAMRVWGEKLGGFVETPEVFSDVLKALPDDPPTLPQFVDLCRTALKRARDGQQALPYRPTPEEQARAEEVVKAVKQATSARREFDPLLWAKRPGSRIAFAAVLDLSRKETRFAEILSDLKAQGVTDGHKLLKVWNGEGFVPV